MLRKLTPFLLLLLLPFSAQATPARNRQAAEVTAVFVEEMFVFPGRAKEIADDLRKRAAAGAFDSVAYGPELAVALTKAMHAIENDAHLNVQYAGSREEAQPLLTVAEARARLAARPERRHEGRPRDDEGMRRGNFGLRSAEYLPGNIAYLRVDTFEDISASRETYAAAMKFLENARAMIVDLRYNRGGSQTAVVYLASHFLPADHGVVTTMRRRGTPEPHVSRVVETPTRLFEKMPLYILTSNETFSAGEGFSYMLQQFGRAKTVGQTTKGGGRPNAFAPLGGGLRLSVSIASVEHPKNPKGWQGIGVQADVTAPVEEALDVAQRLVIEQFASPAIDKLPPHLEGLVTAINGTPAELEAYAAGHYAKTLLESRTAEDRARFLARLHGDFGRMTVVAIENTTPEKTTLKIEGSTGKSARLVVGHEPAPRHAITALHVEMAAN